MNVIFITGIGTDVGKTVAAAIITEALEADYWKPVQAGYNGGTDALTTQQLISNNKTTIHKETYKLKLASSPHIAAKEENVVIDLNKIEDDYLRILNREPSNVNRQPLTTHLQMLQSSITKKEKKLSNNQQSSVNGQRSTVNLIIEGAGGLMVPLNEHEFVIDLIKKLKAKVVLVSRNYLGSINHSLLTASVCKQHNIHVLGWMFNDHYMNYENEIVQWSGYKKIASIPFAENINAAFIKEQAAVTRTSLLQCINGN